MKRKYHHLEDENLEYSLEYDNVYNEDMDRLMAGERSGWE